MADVVAENVATRRALLATARYNRRFGGLLCLFVFWIVLRNAWLCEDAFITFRVADNVVHGFGLRWNVLDRTQVYTHPLWMLALSALHFVVPSIYWTATSLSLAFTAAALWLLLLRAKHSPYQAILIATVLALSKAFVEYSTSGLENPLSHVLLVAFLIEYLKPDSDRSLARMMLWVGLGLTDRMDLVWCFAPPLAHVLLGHARRQALRWQTLVGLSPFVAWEAFSLLYYGFPFPNSAYAKLVPIPAKALVLQGTSYLTNSLSWDPITLFSMSALTVAALCGVGRDRRLVFVAVGVLLHVIYVVRVGGDYMSGRFLTVPLVASMMILSRIDFDGVLEFATAFGIALAFGVAAPRMPLLTNDAYSGLGKGPQGVDDEFGFRFPDTGLLRLSPTRRLDSGGGWIADGIKARREHARVLVYRNIGYFGFFAGPGVHVIDPLGIGDALMARMPFDASRPWGPGHYLRDVPDGYESAAIDAGHIRDGALDAYWQKLELVIRGPIFSGKRLAQIARFNLGLDRPPSR